MDFSTENVYLLIGPFAAPIVKKMILWHNFQFFCSQVFFGNEYFFNFYKKSSTESTQIDNTKNSYIIN